MTAVDLSDGLAAALEYGASHGWRVFPAIPGSKKPYIDDWPNAATTDSVTLFGWWGRWPNALVAAVTGEAFVALDADIKANEPTGFDTLGELGWPFWFETRTVHTPSGGCHAHFQVPSPNIHNTVGKRGRGIGLNLDWRGDGGYVIVPGAGDYRWDPHLGLDTPLAEVPAALLPREPEARNPVSAPRPAATGLDRYAEAALDSACRKILAAPNGQQEATLNSESFAIGTLAGSGGISKSFSRDTLRWAASQLVSYDAWRPWATGEAEFKACRAFDQGIRRPRRAQHG
jgi:hypothetical protein